jgi:hypothetical protein
MKVVIEVKAGLMNSQTKQDKTGQFSSLHERGRDKDGAEAWGKQMVRSARGPFPAILCLIPSVSITPHRVTEWQSEWVGCCDNWQTQQHLSSQLAHSTMLPMSSTIRGYKPVPIPPQPQPHYIILNNSFRYVRCGFKVSSINLCMVRCAGALSPVIPNYSIMQWSTSKKNNGFITWFP